jgi:hypothetical protein
VLTRAILITGANDRRTERARSLNGEFYDLAEYLVGKNPGHVNARGGLLVTPLVAILHGEHFQIVELLHQNGADVDVLSYEDNWHAAHTESISWGRNTHISDRLLKF